MDNTGANDTLVLIEPDDSIWKRVARGVGTDYTDEAKPANAKVEQLQNDLYVWKLPVRPGRFSFVIRNADNALTPPVESPAYPFRVQIDLPPSEASAIFGKWTGTIGKGSVSGPIEVALALDNNGSTMSNIAFLGGTSTFGTSKYALWHTAITADEANFTIPFWLNQDGTFLLCELHRSTTVLQGDCTRTGGQREVWTIRLDHHSSS